jgi:acetylornithine deacetylase/succinyl-diaminopimelate desuccinylase-like protein
VQSVIDFLKTNKDQSFKEFCDYLRIPSISADPQFSADCLKAADFAVNKLKSIGMENAQKIPGKGQPVVYADWLHAPGKPTILIYGHYDVQPPDPMNEWKTPPFEPTVRDGFVWARGCSDNKGQHWMWLSALQAWLAAEKKLPVNVKVVIEGEEESGGETIAQLITEDKIANMWKSDAVVISDGAWFAHDIPSVGVALRGMCYFELEVKGPKFDLHSGLHGGTSPNPLKVIGNTIAKLQNDQGRVLVPGFYDDVEELSDADKKMIRSLPFSNEDYHQAIGIKGSDGEQDYSYLERQWTRPTFEVHGIVGGYQQPGAKTVIPAAATMKFSFRLVPNQKPEKIVKSLKDYLAKIIPNTVTWELRDLHAGPAMVVQQNDPFIQALKPVYKEQYGKDLVFTRCGGSIGIAVEFVNVLKAPVVFVDLGFSDDGWHSPNEHFSLKQFEECRMLCARALSAWGNVVK